MDEVGEKLQAIRSQKGWSQRELAKRAGVTNSTISLIEQGRVSPSVASLKKVLDGIPISLSDFFTSDDQTRQDDVFFRSENMPNVGSDDIVYRLLASNNPNRKMSMLREEYQPGADTGSDMLTHEGEEGGIIVDGQLEVTVDGVTTILHEGDGYYFESRLPHRFRNVGDKPCKVVSSVTPNSF